MSLLNDALRAAEERQQRPDAPSAYTGYAVQGAQRGNRWLILCLLLLILVVAAAGTYWFLVQGGKVAPSPANAAPAAAAGQGKVQRPEHASSALQAQAQPAQVQERSVVDEPVVASPDASEAEPSAPEPAAEPVSTKTADSPASPIEPKEPQVAKPDEPQSGSEARNDESPGAPVVKSTPRSPEAIDRKAARELEALVSDGQLVEAERRLASLAQKQKAPRSRFVVARALLVEGQATRALDWLPAKAAASDAPLRMLRARAFHADGQLQAAITTLQSQVPAVSDQPEYRVTLATLLQQLGDSQEAARHWAELIAWDDSRAPWWVGLAISLEDQGQIRSAARAYEQAAALPGLPPSLADYVQRRLRSLRAG